MARCFSAKKSSRGKELKCGRCAAKIEVGDIYFHFAVGFRGVTQIRCKNHKPRQSELCGSKLSGAYAAIESVEDVLAGKEVTIEDIASALEEASSEIESVRDEYQESFDNMGEGLQQSSTGQEIEEKISSLEEFASTLSEAADSVRSEEDNAGDEDDSDEDKKEAKSQALDNAQTIAHDALDGFSL